MNCSFRRFLLAAAGPTAAAVLLSGCGTTIPRVMSPGSFSTVVIDAGHGGKDSGEHPRGGLYEKEVALDTAKRVRDILDNEGVRTVMTRSSDVFVELDDRVAIADHYGPNAILVSIHYNASGSSAPRGVETYYWRADSYGLATRVQRSMLSETGMPNHGVIRRVLRLTHNPQEPSILCECGYLTNHTDYALASSASYRQKLAEGIADGIVEQHERGDADIGPLPPTPVVVSHHTYRHHHISASRHHRGATTTKKNSRTKKTAQTKKTVKHKPRHTSQN